jgi:phosphatidylglycerophosphatase A
MNRRTPVLQSLLEQIWGRAAVILATGFGVGYSPVMPGTVGSLWGLPLVWCLHRQEFSPMAGVSITAGLILIGVPICSRAAKTFALADPGPVVLDEIAAFPVVFCLVPLDLTTGVIGFLWFRLFDVTKPWPVNRLEKLPGGIGIMADDLLAGVYAAIALWLTIRLFG